MACNEEALDAFLVAQTQMRREGFRYEGLRAALDMAGITCTPELFGKLRVMEIAAVNHMGQLEARARDRNRQR